MFRDLSRRSQQGKPSCSVVFGSSTAGGAYLPGLSDYTIFVRNQAQVFLGGPPLVKMATGEIVDAGTLGGAEMHATITGLADQIATDEYVIWINVDHSTTDQIQCIHTNDTYLSGLMRFAKLVNGSSHLMSR